MHFEDAILIQFTLIIYLVIQPTFVRSFKYIFRATRVCLYTIMSAVLWAIENSLNSHNIQSAIIISLQRRLVAACGQKSARREASPAQAKRQTLVELA